jgi:predicted peptidase
MAMSTGGWEAASRYARSGLPYLLFEPMPFDDGQAPLVIFLHGSGERTKHRDRLDKNALCQVGLPKLVVAGSPGVSRAIAIACPQTSENRWAQETERVIDLVDELMEATGTSITATSPV